MMKVNFFLFALIVDVKAFSLTRDNYQLSRSLSHSLKATAAVLTNETNDIPLSSIRGEADRAFRSGMVLEKNGQARAASASFHEAATLFQCYLDCDNEFQHVSMIDRDEIPTMLAYTCVRLAHLSHDALGDAKAAFRLYRDATRIDPKPSAVSYDGMGTAIEASGGPLEDAIEAYREALKLTPENHQVVFHLGVALERVGEEEESEKWMDLLRRSELEHSCLVGTE